MIKNKNNMMCVGIDYLDGLLTPDDIEDIDKILAEASLQLITNCHFPKYICGFEALFPQIRILLSSDLAVGIYGGVIANVICAVLSKFFFSIKEKVKSKKCIKQSGSEIQENVTPVIHVSIGKTNIILPLDISDEQYQYFVDHLFDAIKGQNTKETTYCYYYPETNEYRFLTKYEVIREEHINHKEENE